MKVSEIFTREVLVSVVSDGSIDRYWLDEAERVLEKLSVALPDVDDVDGRMHDNN